MSSEKRMSWRKGLVVWQGRLYLTPETIAAVAKQAKREDRERVYLMSKALEAIFTRRDSTDLP